MNFPEKVQVREVCPRDGWQKFPKLLSADEKIRLIRSILDYGAKELEIGVFSENPRLARQYGDIEEVVREILPYAEEKGAVLSALVNTCEDARRAKAVGIREIGYFISVSETFGKGFGSTAEESFRILEDMMQIPGLHVSLNLGAVFGCPFGDETPVERTIDYAKRAEAAGVDSIGLADSAGICTPDETHRILTEILKSVSPEQISMHLHNTEGFGMANAYAALDLGISRFDVSLGAMGGCPVIPGARGNIATEDFVNLLQKMGISCDICLEQCVEASLLMSSMIGNPIISSKAEIVSLEKRGKAQQ